MTTNIYVLKLEKGFYYVGKSDNVEKRYNQHLAGYGSTITKKYKPLQIEKIYENASPFDEDKFVKEYMDKYGIDKVRGGTYINEILTDNQIINLKKELWVAVSNLATLWTRVLKIYVLDVEEIHIGLKIVMLPKIFMTVKY